MAAPKPASTLPLTALGVLVGLMAVAASASAYAAGAPAIAPGYPVIAPEASTVQVGADGRAVVAGVSRDADTRLGAAAFGPSGRPLWWHVQAAGCQKCDHPIAARLGADGLFQPFGLSADGAAGALDRQGRPLAATCSAPVADDGNCYRVTTHFQPSPWGWRVAVERLGSWAQPQVDLVTMLAEDESTAPAPTVVIDGVVIVRPTDQRLIGLDSASGRRIWARDLSLGALGPQRAGTHAVVSQDTAIEWLDVRTGAPIARTELAEPVTSMVADPHRGAVVASTGSRPADPGAVWHLTPGGAPRRLGTRVALGDPLAIAPDGATVTVRRGRDLSTITAGGRVRWRLALGSARSTAAAVAYRPNGDAMVASGGLLYRVRARPESVPGFTTPSMRVAPARLRLHGPRQTCGAAAGGGCTPATPLGATIELRLPTAHRHATITLTLRHRDRRGRGAAVWSGRAEPRGAGRVWLALNGGGLPGCSACARGPIAPGPHQLEARWTHRGGTARIAVPVNILAHQGGSR